MHGFSPVKCEISYEVQAIQMPVIMSWNVIYICSNPNTVYFKFKAYCFERYYNQNIVFTSVTSHNMHTADAMQNKVKQK